MLDEFGLNMLIGSDLGVVARKWLAESGVWKIIIGKNNWEKR